MPMLDVTQSVHFGAVFQRGTAVKEDVPCRRRRMAETFLRWLKLELDD